MTALQLAMLSGATITAGLVMLVAGLVPAPTHLKDAIGRLQPRITLDTLSMGEKADSEVRLGRWAERHLPAIIWGTAPEKDLALLGRTKATFYGSKLISGILGLLVVPVISVATMLLGLPIPIAVPVLGSIGFAAIMWFLPNSELRDQARKAREEFSYALVAFVEMVALERLSGATVPEALLRAADTGDSWVFQRLATVLRRTQYTGQNPWDALADMGHHYDLPDLVDLADIMRLAGADGTRIYSSLRARGAAMRNATLNQQISRANADGERIAIPVTLLVLVLAITLVVPAVLRMI